MAPNLHWPDTMFSYDHATGAALLCVAVCVRALVQLCVCVCVRGVAWCSVVLCSVARTGCATPTDCPKRPLACQCCPRNPRHPSPHPKLAATGVMYTCDAFGMHYCSQDPFDTGVDVIMPHYRCVGVVACVVACVVVCETQRRPAALHTCAGT
jgi:hypothetical protein